MNRKFNLAIAFGLALVGAGFHWRGDYSHAAADYALAALLLVAGLVGRGRPTTEGDGK